MPFSKVATTLFLPLFLGACQTTPVQSGTPVPDDQVVAEPRAQTSHQADYPVDSELLYQYLVGEIGARTGHLQTALTHYMQAMRSAKDPYAAQRATRIALHLEDYQTGLQAVSAWLTYTPDSLPAHQFAAILYLRTGQLAQAQAQFEKLLALVGDADKSSLLLVASALKEEPDKAVVLQLMRNMLRNRPQDAHAHYAVSVVEAAQERYSESEHSLRTAIALKPDWVLPHILMGQVLAAQGKQAEALQHLRERVRLHPDEHALRHAYARHLIEAERFAEALPEFRHLHEQMPQDAEISYGLAILATQQEMWPEARNLWQDLRSESKFYADATYFLAQVEEATDNTVLAIGLYNSVPAGIRRVDAMIRASNLLAQTDRLGQAREQLGKLRISHPEASADIYLAEAQILTEQTDDAEAILDFYAQALQTHPEHNDLQYSRGLYLANQQRYIAMEADFLAVLKRDAQHAETLNALGYTLADRNVRLAEALDYIERALELRPDEAAVLDSMGWVQYRLGNLAQAETYLHRALEHMPDDEIASHLGEVLWVQGKHDAARKVWREALQAKPASGLIQEALQRLGVDL